MTHRKISEVLDDLVRIAGRIIMAPHLAFGQREALLSLRQEVADAAARPADGERVIDDMSAMLVQCLLHVGPEEEAHKWRAVAEVLAPLVMADLRRAREAELRVLGSGEPGQTRAQGFRDWRRLA